MPTTPLPNLDRPFTQEELEFKNLMDRFALILADWSYGTRSHLPGGVDFTNFCDSLRALNKVCNARPDLILPLWKFATDQTGTALESEIARAENQRVRVSAAELKNPGNELPLLRAIRLVALVSEADDRKVEEKDKALYEILKLTAHLGNVPSVDPVWG